MTENQINYQKHLETVRSNQAQEKLTSERDAETKRSNLAREFETNRSNVVREDETHRSNLVSEYLKKYNTDTAAAASMYSADQSRVGRENSAYISKHGISKSDVESLAGIATEGAEKVLSSKPVKGLATTMVALGVHAAKPVVEAIDRVRYGTNSPGAKVKVVRPDGSSGKGRRH